MLIPCEVDFISGSSREAERRKANSEASKRFRTGQRQEMHLMRIPGDMQVGVLSVKEHQGTYVVYPRGEILVQCQGLFGSAISEFKPQQVFIVMQLLSTDLHKELQFLLRIMQTRLCSAGVRDTDEGCFIRLAIAFSRRISLQGVPLHPSVKNEGYLADFQTIVPGIWEINVRFPSPGCVVPVRGSVAELIQHITYKEPTSQPPPPKILGAKYEA